MTEPLVPDAWHELLGALTAESGAVMVIGAVDTGKTVLSCWLAERLAERGPVAMVDADLGQSIIGPPGTVGWRMAGPQAEEFMFVGVTSPARRALGAVTATWRACERARRAGAAWLVLDSSGYVDGPGAVALKRAKLDLVRPSDVVLLADQPGRLEAIARSIRPGEARVYHLQAVAPERKSLVHRREWRRERFAQYLAGAQVQRIELAGRAVYGGRPWLWGGRWPRLEAHLSGLLVGLSDAEGIGLVIGLLRGVTDDGAALEVLAPPVELERVAAISLGMVRLEEDGTQIVDNRRKRGR